MLDFFTIEKVEKGTRNRLELDIIPEFIVNLRTKDLMIKGGDFYAVWDAEANLWSTSEQTVIDIVDAELKQVYEALRSSPAADKYDKIGVKYMRYARTGSIDMFHKYVQKQMRDVFHPLDEKIIFLNTKTKKSDYVSKRLPYAMEEGSIEAYEELVSTLYDPEERDKLEWAIGAIISGDAKKIQKFEVLYGDKGTGKSTILDIIDWLFGGEDDGYVSTFTAKELGRASSAFALESFKNGPLVSIQHDGNLSRIEDNTKLNSIVSHESLEVNAKYTKIYTTKFNTFLFMGTNKPVMITDAKSGILRRLIDVRPSGRKLPYKKYHELKNQVKFELGAIAFHCLNRYKEMGEDYYEGYEPLQMMAATNDFYDYIEYNLEQFKKKDEITLAEAWQLYKEYCDFAHTSPMKYRIFRTELMNYYRKFKEQVTRNGVRIRNLYSGFRIDKFEPVETKGDSSDESWLKFDSDTSIFDETYREWKAQYTKEDGSPRIGWAYVKTHLKDIDPHNLHWVKPGDEHLICVDFDLRNELGEKDLALNIKAASLWPKTYAELSKSGGGIHLYYFYDGDVSKLSSIFDEHIEIKVFTGGSSLRRLLTKCNNLPIATIKSNLPLKGDTKLVNWDGIKNEKMLRTMILKNLNKEYHQDTSSSIDYIKKLLDDAYESGLKYDVSDMYDSVLIVAMNSTNQADRCVKVVGEMQFRSEDSEDSDIFEAEAVPSNEFDDLPLTFFDIEIGRPDEETNNPGIFLIVWKYGGLGEPFHHMVNPEPEEVEELLKHKLVGYNCRKYDNHMCYARSVGYSNLRLYRLSNDMINNHRGYFGPAYNASYIDVLDFITEKMSLKKWEIKLDIPHKEMDIPWDEPIPVDRWNDLIKYCENDVLATEAVFNARQADFMAREIQVDIVKLLHGDINVCPNDTTNTLSKRIIFGRNVSPQNEFNYRDMSLPVGSDQYEEYREKFGPNYRFRVFNRLGLPLYRDYIPGEELEEGYSILPFFPGYTFENGVSTYLGEKVGEGGRVYSVPGMYTNVWDGDISSQHPHSIIAEVLFGPKYTAVFEDIVKARVAVKHHDFETAGTLLNGALKPYLTDEHASGLAQALKIVINSIYGLTKAGFDNEFRDRRNVDNIVAKRGALFMTLLKREVEDRGYMVCHIKTDSIKIPNADEEIIGFVTQFGREFGYEFETEGVFSKFCLLNDAAYIAKCDNGLWITKAAQFNKDKSPYTYKRLFSKEPIVFKDMCETVSVNKGALYLDMNEDLEGVSYIEKALEKALKKHKANGTDPEKDANIPLYRQQIAKGHNYKFVGRVGQFTPIKDGYGGGVLCCIDGDKISAPGGTKGYRWLESEDIKQFGLSNPINEQYYIDKVDEAIGDINALDKDGLRGFEWLVAEDDFMNPPE